MRNWIVVALLALAANAHAVGSYLGTDNQDVSVTSFTVALPAGSNHLGAVAVDAPVGISSGTNTMTVNPDGSINANTTVAASTQTIRGRNGNTITSETIGSSEALHVVNLGMPDLAGKVAVYKSSDAMVVAGTITLTGLAKSVDIQALTQDCTFRINGGDSINVAKNTAEAYDFAYTLSNPSVTLTAKSAGATCKARIVGAN